MNRECAWTARSEVDWIGHSFPSGKFHLVDKDRLGCEWDRGGSVHYRFLQRLSSASVDVPVSSNGMGRFSRLNRDYRATVQAQQTTKNRHRMESVDRVLLNNMVFGSGVMKNRSRRADLSALEAPMSRERILDGLSVLVVDDNNDACELTALVLEMAGARVAAASSVSHALDRLRQPWDVIVTDIGMPGLTGYDLMMEIRQRRLQIPVLALTGFDTPEHRQRVLASGFAEHLTKPIAPERLNEAVSEAARQRMTHRAHQISRI